MGFSSAPYFGGQYIEQHRAAHQVKPEILLAEKVRVFLGYGIYSPIHRYRVQVWASVAWVHVPGYRPRFIPLSAIA